MDKMNEKWGFNRKFCLLKKESKYTFQTENNVLFFIFAMGYS